MPPDLTGYRAREPCRTLDPELWNGWKHTFGNWLRDQAWRAWFDKNAAHFSAPLSALVRELSLPVPASAPTPPSASERPASAA